MQFGGSSICVFNGNVCENAERSRDRLELAENRYIQLARRDGGLFRPRRIILPLWALPQGCNLPAFFIQ